MKKNSLAIGLLLVFSLGSRLVDLSGPSVWTDEAATVVVSRLPVLKIIDAIARHDMNPPGSYLLFHFWGLFSESLTWMRVLPALFGTATVVLLYLFGTAYFNRRAGFVASLLFLVFPLSISCMRQVRYPAILAFFVLGATWAFARLIEKPSIKRGILYGLLGLVCAYLHYYSAFMFAFHAVLLGLNVSKLIKWKPFAFALLVLVIGYLPWLPALLHQLSVRQSAGLESDFPWLALVPLILVYTTQGWNLWNLPDFWIRLTEQSLAMTLPEWLPVVFAFPFFIALVIGLVAKQKHSLGRQIITGFVLVPIGIFLLLSLFMPLFSPQYFMAFLPAFALGAAMGLDKLLGRKMIVGIVLVMAVFAVSVGEAGNYYRTQGSGENWKGMVGFVKNHIQKGDLLLVPNLAARFCVDMYDKGDLDVAFVTHQNKDQQVIDEKIVSEAFPAIVKGYDRVWFVEYYSNRFDPDHLLSSRMDELGFSVPLSSLYENTEAFTQDPRLRLTLYIQKPSMIAKYLPREMEMSHLQETWFGKIIRGVYAGQGAMRWSERESSFLLSVSKGERVCASGFAPSMLYPSSVINADLILNQYPSGKEIVKKETELLGGFWICTDSLEIDSAIEVIISCRESFIPDEIFKDGDHSKKCLQLRRVWAEPVLEPGDG